MRTTPETLFSHVRVSDAMHRGIISVHPDTPLRAVAKIMADHRIHAVAISAAGDGIRPPGILTALDVVTAAASNEDRTAGELAGTELVSISTSQRLDHAAKLMAEHELSHLIVTDAASGLPSGVLSTLDILAAYGA